MNLKDESKMAFHPTTVERKTKLGYNKGTTAHLIDDPDGNTWIMKGFNNCRPSAGARLRNEHGFPARVSRAHGDGKTNLGFPGFLRLELKTMNPPN
jgi:hypothetical protein